MTATIERRKKLTELADPRTVGSAPAEAFAFDGVAIEFDNGASGTSVPIEFLARTGDPIEHWYWGRIVHDFAGMSHRDVIPIDYRHDGDELLGYLNKFTVKNGDLYLGGSLESCEAEDKASQVIARGKRGIPYQGSIYFNQETAIFEWLPGDMTAEVNGRVLTGPLVIAREWELRACALTPYGCDPGTAAKFSAEGLPVAGSMAGSLSWKGFPNMTKAPEGTAPQGTGELAAKDAPATPAAATPAATPATSTNPATPAAVTPTPATPEIPAVQTVAKDQLDAARVELKRYTDKFGADGANYFGEGLSFQDAQDRHIGKLSADLTAERARADAAEQQLAAAQLSVGEKDPIKTGSASQKAVGFDSLFKPK